MNLMATYIHPDETSAEGLDDGNGEDSEPSDDVPPIPDFQEPTGPSVDMTDKSPLDFFQACSQRMPCWIILLTKVTSMLNNILTQPSLLNLAYTAGTKKFTTEMSS